MMVYPKVAYDRLSQDGKYDPEKVVNACCQVLTINRDVVELLQKKGIEPETIGAICSLAAHACKDFET